jgi:D-alanyl-D-alanine dipeptidase
MAVIAVVLIFIGNLDLSHIGTPSGTAENGDAPLPTITDNVQEEMIEAAPPMVTPDIEADMLFYHHEGGLLELPLAGATGWAAVSSPLRDASGGAGAVVSTLAAGTVFTIVNHSGDWWFVRLPDETTGWVDSRRCFINLPDVLPSIVYNITNASASMFRSSGFALAGVTGQALYNAHGFNYRLGRYEYIVPGMLSMALSLHTVQQAAWADNFTLVIYESYRPRSAQTATLNAMNVLRRENAMVQNAITNSNFTLAWFISTGVSSHQRGAAVDVTLARVHETEIVQTGSHSFFRVSQHTEINTGTLMHELSPGAAIILSPQTIQPAEILSGTVDMNGPAMTGGIIRMQWYFAAAGFQPLASEWWHFNHRPAINIATASNIVGEFYTERVYSIPPTG